MRWSTSRNKITIWRSNCVKRTQDTTFRRKTRGTAPNGGGPERPEGSNEPSRPERRNLSMPSHMDTAPPLIVKKPNGKWRMCVDFMDLNRVCLKDSYPLPQIDNLVDSTARHELLSFMDAFSGYNQIKMKEEDQEKTSFVTSQGLFCYKVMPFGLKNAGATYQRLMNKMFAHQLRRNVQVYVDDMLVKSVRKNDHLNNFQETFNTLRSYNIKLNPSKCMFGVTAGKFLGFMVSQRGIEVNPEKVRAILELKPPRTVKAV